MLGANTANPLVFPKTTTRYKVTLNENGCINSDSVLVNVVDFVTLNAGPDQTICATDTTLLSPQTNGLRFSWTPSETIIDPSLKNAQVFPAATTQYTIESSIGKCSARDIITVRTVPYPFVNAGADTMICFQDTARLNAQIIASRFSWNPTNTLSNSSVLNPGAYPATSTTYILTAYDTLGCPKPGMDDVTVTVMPEINAFAGNDTAIVIGQPLRLTGQGAELFEWQPSFPLDRNDVGNPTAMLDNDITFVLKAYTENGCFSLDTMKVLVFKSDPDIFVPNAFAPLGRNNILKPVAPGISTLHYFRVFNRYGQLMFTTSRTGEGWDGKYEGKTQDTGTYVWMVSGTDFTGKLITKKGTCVLIR
jgi:gliding motility-associated-like protein